MEIRSEISKPCRVTTLYVDKYPENSKPLDYMYYASLSENLHFLYKRPQPVRIEELEFFNVTRDKEA